MHEPAPATAHAVPPVPLVPPVPHGTADTAPPRGKEPVPEPRAGAGVVHVPPSGRAALAQMARTPSYQLLFAVAAMVAGFVYSLLLPFEYTQRFSFANWHFLGPRLAAFSIAYGLAFGAVVSLQVYAVDQLARRARSRGATTTLGVLASLASCLACCSPLVPGLLAVFGVSGMSLVTTSATIEHFAGTEQNALLGGGLLLLVLTALWSARRVARSSCLSDPGSCPAS